jgi:glucose-6-phosphate-specific signal transduction histidine kinase
METNRSDTKDSKTNGETRETTEAWKEVETRFAALSESLVSAVRTAWSDEESQRAVKEMESGLHTIAGKVASAVDEAAGSPEGQRLRTEAEKTAQAVHDAGEQMVKEARPHVADALGAISESFRSVADELNRYSAKRATEADDADRPQT